MKLLQRREDPGYPTEYLVSRVRGRRVSLITAGMPAVSSAAPFEGLPFGKYERAIRDTAPEDIWRDLMLEYRWVYSQMNGRLRRLFGPFFLYSELKTVFICLRRGKGGKTGTVDELLDASLLSDKLKEVLTKSADVRATVMDVERIFSSCSSEFRGLSRIFATDGLRGVEQALTNIYLTVAVNDKLHPLMKKFFIRLIDSRNIMGLSKYLRQGAPPPLPFLEGGSISPNRLRNILGKKDAPGLDSLVRIFAGVRVETPEPARIELAMYKGTTRFLRRAGRDPFGVGPILDYLWSCSIEALNLSILSRGRDLDRDIIAAELVQ
jgi:vacuolar-type H+-ATPase subunit C/Vma6